MAGYHKMEIPRGVFGEFSKIQEEVLEIQDSIAQNCKIMELIELSDLYGAISGYLKKHHPEITMDDLAKMAEITGRAFESGGRNAN